MAEDIDVEHFRKRLLQLREEISTLTETRNQSTATVKLDQSSVGRLSRMDALQQQAMAQSTQQRAEATLQRIEAALKRCDDGSYGFCLDCDEPIAPRRLEFDPTALRCVQCAEAKGQ